ncbi:MAG: HAD-IA family hydrolase [Nanoarchaeota archaeon]|nr:HAD-IA family hydrolase [Nanoarchaeota archaeon]MBU1005465.1 HAD-IA family hydrolase [Nanoarchaeota archaeon]MBU1947035.1 HAD-IA family hydrolase [Nanoarchaeota archaeon]
MKLLIFDIDGVLVDVSNSYRLAIKKTAEFFLGKILDMSDVENIKNRGINNDHEATEILIRENGGDFREQVIIKKFQEYYLGRKMDGFIKNEKCLIDEKVLKKLKKYKLAVFTGRPRLEAEFALDKFKIRKHFKEIVCMEDVIKGKPDPEGILNILKKMNIKAEDAVYIGDNLADAGAAKSANVKFIGVVAPNADKVYTKNILKSEGAGAVLNSVDDVVKVVK